MNRQTLLAQVKPHLSQIESNENHSIHLFRKELASIIKKLNTSGAGEAVFRFENQKSGDWAEFILTPDEHTNLYSVVIFSGDSEAGPKSYSISPLSNVRYSTTCDWVEDGEFVQHLEVKFTRNTEVKSLIHSELELAMKDLSRVANTEYVELKILG